MIRKISDYDAIGCGEDFANAAMYLGHNALEAAKTACACSYFVGGPPIGYIMQNDGIITEIEN